MKVIKRYSLTNALYTAVEQYKEAAKHWADKTPALARQFEAQADEINAVADAIMRGEDELRVTD